MVLERLLRQRRARVPHFAEAEGAADAESGGDPLLEGGRARRVVAAERHAGDADRRVPLQVVEQRRQRDFVVRMDVRRVARLALAGAVERERRHSTREEHVLPFEELLLRRVEARQENGQRRAPGAQRASQVADHRGAFERDLDPLGTRVEQPVRLAERGDRLVGGFAVEVHVDHPHELREVVGKRRVVPGLPGGERAALRLGLARELRMPVAVLDPRG